MDFGALVVILLIVASGLLMIIGPLMELKGKILFLEPKYKPRTTGRWGIGLMVFSFVMFLIGLVLRAYLSSEIVSPIVVGSYFLWFAGGIVAVVRNETLKMMVENPKGRNGEI